MKTFAFIFSWFSQRLGKRRFRVSEQHAAPANPDPWLFYLINDDGEPWSGMLICPCGCGATIHLSLLPDDRPSWRAEVHENRTITVWPSIWRTTGCQSHFLLNRGAVRYVRERRLIKERFLGFLNGRKS